MKQLKTLAVLSLGLLLPLGTWAQTAQRSTVQKVAKAQAPKGEKPQLESRSAARGSDWLHREVRHELVMLPYYSVFDNLAYRIDGDKVTLMGQVSRPSLKPDAENVVKKIEGVAAVDNQIEVLPTSPNDDRLRVALYREIYSDPTLSRYSMQAVPPIHIIVKSGRVKLEGVVANETQKNIAGIRANSVSGIFEVTNNLRVEQEK